MLCFHIANRILSKFMTFYLFEFIIICNTRTYNQNKITRFILYWLIHWCCEPPRHRDSGAACMWPCHSSCHIISQFEDLSKIQDQVVVIVQVLSYSQIFVSRAKPNMALAINVRTMPACPQIPHKLPVT